jgi:hypothetical protein
MASAETFHQIAVDRPKIEAEVQQEIANWRGLLASEAVVDGREFLRKVLAEPIRFTPDGRSYRFRGRTRMGELIAGAVLPTCVASPGGSKQGRALPTKVASPTGLAPFTATGSVGRIAA